MIFKTYTKFATFIANKRSRIPRRSYL